MTISLNNQTDIITINKGETIHTENSHKFNHENIKTIGNWAGLSTKQIVEDDNKWFSLVHYIKE